MMTTIRNSACVFYVLKLSFRVPTCLTDIALLGFGRERSMGADRCSEGSYHTPGLGFLFLWYGIEKPSILP